MQKLLVPVFFIAISIAVSAADYGYKIAYDGGSIPDVKAGTSMKLYIGSAKIELVTDKTVVTLPPSAVTEISYGQGVARPMGIAPRDKKKRPFIGLTWINGDQKGGFVMQCDRSDYRGVLIALEGVTGKKAVNLADPTVKN